jgi:Group II intron, maturase-specific domain
MKVLRDKIRAATNRRQVGRPVSAMVADLNPVLRGWAAYFRNGNSAGKFSTIDSYVHERLAIFDSRKRGIPGRRWGRRCVTAPAIRCSPRWPAGSSWTNNGTCPSTATDYASDSRSGPCQRGQL